MYILYIREWNCIQTKFCISEGHYISKLQLLSSSYLYPQQNRESIQGLTVLPQVLEAKPFVVEIF